MRRTNIVTLAVRSTRTAYCFLSSFSRRSKRLLNEDKPQADVTDFL
ncbi:hypothetical protein [Solibacillus isronensis]